jgi:hypothetical protein
LEIRNTIYHLSLIEEDEISITSELKPPALLSTCRQIRNEAQQISYFGNTFAIVMLNCDSTLYRKFTENVIRPLGIQPDDPRWRSVAELEGVDWRNLMSWCRCVWEGKLGSVNFSSDAGGDGDYDWCVIQTATIIALDSMGCRREQLRQLGLLAAKVDSRWSSKESEQ